MPGEFPTLHGGHTELTAAMINQITDFVRRQNRLVATPPLHALQQGDSWLVYLDRDDGFWARLGEPGPGGNSWEEVTLTREGGFATATSGRYGDGTVHAAREVNNLNVPEGTVVWLRPTVGLTGTSFCYNAPVYDPERRERIFWARLTEESAGVYGYQEMERGTDGNFRDADGGRKADVSQLEAAVELNGTQGIPADTVVLMCDSARGSLSDDALTSAPEDDLENSVQRVGFRYGGGGGNGVWARLSGRPHTDGAGGYSWVEVEWTSGGLLQDKEGGRGSEGIRGRAYEASGETKVPTGTLVRLQPGALVEAQDADGTPYQDQRYTFAWGQAAVWGVLGLGALWTLDLQEPTTGLWSLGFDESGDAAQASLDELAAPRRNQTCELRADAVCSFRLTWDLDVPSLEESGADYVEVTERPFVDVPAGCTASALQALLDELPVLGGNVSCSGGPLGSAAATDCPITGLNGRSEVPTTSESLPIVIEFVNDLAEMLLPGFSVSLASGGSTLLPSGGISVAGSGPWTTLLRYDATCDDGSASSLGGTLKRLASRRFGALSLWSDAGAAASVGVNEGAVTLGVAGYPTQGSLPTLSLRNWLGYGDSGLEEVEVVPGEARHLQEATDYQLSGAKYALCQVDELAEATGDVPPQLARPGDYPLVLRGREAGGRDDVPAGTVVRLSPTSLREQDEAGDTLQEYWAFQAPAAGFWAQVLASSSATRGASTYAVLPVGGSDDATPGTPLRRVLARESAGCTWVPVNALVRVEQAGDSWAFRYTPGEEVRLIRRRDVGYLAAEPLASGQLQPSDDPCVLSGTPDAPDGYFLIGVLTGYVAGESALLPQYRVGVHPPVAASGVAGLVSTLPQILGGGSKALPGRFYLAGDGAPDDPRPTGGEVMPATSYLTCSLTTTRQFVGMVGTSGDYFGLESVCPTPPDTVYRYGTCGTLSRAIAADDVLLPVESAVLYSVNGLNAANTFLKIDSEYLEVTATCFDAVSAVSPPARQQVWRVLRGRQGSTAASHADGATIERWAIWPANGYALALLPETYFVTSADAFAINGVVGGDAVVDLEYPVGMGPTLTFLGGILTDVTYRVGPNGGFTGYIYNMEIDCADGHAFRVVNGLIQFRLSQYVC